MLDDAPTPTGCRRTEPQRACAAIVDHLDHITHSGPISQQFHRGHVAATDAVGEPATQVAEDDPWLPAGHRRSPWRVACSTSRP
jgi:hypothetical protein